MKTTEAMMEILAAYDLMGSYRDAAALVGCSHHTVARYVRARDPGGLRTTPAQRDQLIDPFREKIEEWVDASHRRVRADVAQRKLQAMGYAGSERTARRAIAEAKATYRAGHRRRFRPWLPEPGLWFQWDYADGPLVAGHKSWLWCAWLAWSRFRVVLPVRDVFGLRNLTTTSKRSSPTGGPTATSGPDDNLRDDDLWIDIPDELPVQSARHAFIRSAI